MKGIGFIEDNYLIVKAFPSPNQIESELTNGRIVAMGKLVYEEDVLEEEKEEWQKKLDPAEKHYRYKVGDMIAYNRHSPNRIKIEQEVYDVLYVDDVILLLQ